jgi:hypothetical protein
MSVLRDENSRVQKVMVFSRKPNLEEHVQFLRGLAIWVLWFDGDELSGEEESLRKVRALLREG